MIRISGPSFDHLDPQIEACERLVTELTSAIMAMVAGELGVVRTAAAPPPESTEPPGEPAVSLDTLAIIATLWGTEVLAELVPFIGDVWDFGAEKTRTQVVSALGPERAERIPALHDAPMRSLAEDYLANAPNRVAGFADELWELARAQLLEGFMQGESIDALRDRLRVTVPQLSAARARTIARTEVISASNAGSLAMVEIAGFTGTKSWLATEDERTRPTHVLADGQTVPMQEAFIVGNSPLFFPGDPSGPLEEIVNCRCTLTYDLDDEPLTAAGGTMAGEWIGVLLKEGVFTGDGRMFAPGAVDFAPFPMPLRWQIADDEGHRGSVIVGNITSAVRQGDLILAKGTFDLNGQYGAEAYRMVREGFLYGVSIDADDFVPSEVEYVYGAGPAGLESGPVVEKTVFHGGRLRASTLCAIPAFVEARISLAASDPMEEVEPVIASGEEVSATIAAEGVDIADPATLVSGSDSTKVEWLHREAPLTAAAYVLTIPDVPPVEWFEEPTDVDIHGALTVTDEGRVYGYLAPAGVAHRSFKERVTVPMRNVDYSLFMGRETLTAGGGRVVTGALTMDCGHASTGYRDPAMAMDHYDNACSIVATVRIGENARGVWVAGALVPGLSANQVARIMACQLSGDWRPHREKSGWREFAGALLVPVPGFAMARTEASVRMEEGQLVASAVPVEFAAVEHDCGCKVPEVDVDLAARMEELAASVGLGLSDKMNTLRTMVHGLEV